MEDISALEQQFELEHIVRVLYQGAPVNLEVLRPVSSVTVVPVSFGLGQIEQGENDGSVSLNRDVTSSMKQLETNKNELVLGIEDTSELNAHESEVYIRQSDPFSDLTFRSIIKSRFEQNMLGKDIYYSELLPKPKSMTESKEGNQISQTIELSNRKIRDFFASKRIDTTFCLPEKCESTKMPIEALRLITNSCEEDSSMYEKNLPISQSNAGSEEESKEYLLLTHDNLEYTLFHSSPYEVKAMAVPSEEDFDEMWQLPNDICRICAKRSPSCEHMFSDTSKELKIIEMIHNHLQIVISQGDELPQTVCQNCIASLQVADKLTKTCSAANRIFSRLSEHVCKVSTPAKESTQTESVQDIGNSPRDCGTGQNSLIGSTNGYDFHESNPETNIHFFSEVLVVGGANDFDQIKSKYTPTSVIKIAKKEDTMKVKKLLEILKTLNAKPIVKKKKKERERPFIVADIERDCESLVKSKDPSSQDEDISFSEDEANRGDNNDSGDFLNEQSKQNTYELNVLNEDCANSMQDCEDSPVQGTRNSCGDKLTVAQFAKLRKVMRQKERRLLARGNKPHQCCDCDYVAPTKEELSEHKITHLKCKYCDKHLRTKVNLIEHERVHTKEKPYICDQCGLRYRTKAQMMQHAQRHNPYTPYKCEVCGQAFSVRKTYTAHVMRHNPESEFLCETCGRSFKSNDALRFHKLSHRTFKCIHCDESFTYRKLQVHKKTHTGEGYCTCSECGKKFLSRERLKNHQIIHEGVFPFNCGVCHRSFKRITHLQAHRERHAGDLLLGILFYRCAMCEESYEKASLLSRHVRSHSDDERLKIKAFKCSSCDKCFSEERELHSHERLHDTPLFSCSTCNLTFSQREDLNSHANDHFEDKPLACNVCGKRFGAIVNYNNHKAIHSLSKPYSCGVCSKAFKTLNGLNQHKVAHSDVRKFSCNTCSLSFKRRDALRNHERTHFTERPYSCSVCARSFKAKTDCTTHVRRHRLLGIEGGTVIESLYNCPSCSQTFTMNVDLTNHMKRAHSHVAEVLGTDIQDDDSLLQEEINSCTVTVAAL